MNNSTITGLMLCALVLVSQSALAGPDHGWKHKRHPHALRHGDHDYARVVDVDPIIHRVRTRIPQERCFQDTIYEEGGYRSGSRGSAGQMILGGLLGAAVGSQIGDGDGRRAATVAGAVIGTAIGHDVADRRNVRTVAVPRTIERCETVYVDDYEERVEGYHVTYVYQGRRMTTRMPYDPGERVRVRVDVYPDE